MLLQNGLIVVFYQMDACQHIITIYIILNALGKLLQHNIHGILPQLNEYSNILAHLVN